MKNLGLNFKVVYAGSEPALIQAFRQAEQNKTPLIGYFYEPQWFIAEVPLVKVNLPAHTPGCDADAAKVACDYPKYELNKVVSTKFANSGSPAYSLVKKIHVDEPGPEHGCRVHRQGQHEPGFRRAEMDRRELGQGRRLAQVGSLFPGTIGRSRRTIRNKNHDKQHICATSLTITVI